MNDADLNFTRALLSFLSKSPTAYQAVENIVAACEAAGFLPLRENERWQPEPGKGYYLTRNLSSLVAFRMPEGNPTGFQVMASHSDSPTFRLKPSYELESGNLYIRLDTERCGGALLYPWLDRPLSVAGRIVCRKGNTFTALPVTVDRDLCLIPSVAIHMNRNANDNLKLNPACDLFPLLSGSDGKGKLAAIVAEAAGVEAESIADMDLFLYDRTGGRIWGIGNEFFSSPRIDNLMCAYGTLQGLLSAKPTDTVQVYAVFDNEETGSDTKQGAGSTLLRDTLKRIAGAGAKPLEALLPSSFLVSADNGHARHPNHPELSDPINSPVMNGGVVIKSAASQKYATDGVSSAIFSEICARAQVPVQLFSNRSDLPGGSTLGSIADTTVPMNTVDIGLAQLAMHSCYETAGCADTGYLIRASKAFYESSVLCHGDGQYELISR